MKRRNENVAISFSPVIYLSLAARGKQSAELGTPALYKKTHELAELNTRLLGRRKFHGNNKGTRHCTALPLRSSEDLDILGITVGVEKVVVVLVRVQDPPVLRTFDAVGGLATFEFLTISLF